MERSFATRLTAECGRIAGRLTDLHVPAVSRLVVATAAGSIAAEPRCGRCVQCHSQHSGAGRRPPGIWSGPDERAVVRSVRPSGRVIRLLAGWTDDGWPRGPVLPYHYAVLILPALWSLICMGRNRRDVEDERAAGPLRPFLSWKPGNGFVSLAVLLRPLGVRSRPFSCYRHSVAGGHVRLNVDRRLKLTAMCGCASRFGSSPFRRYRDITRTRDGQRAHGLRLPRRQVASGPRAADPLSRRRCRALLHSGAKRFPLFLSRYDPARQQQSRSEGNGDVPDSHVADPRVPRTFHHFEYRLHPAGGRTAVV